VIASDDAGIGFELRETVRKDHATIAIQHPPTAWTHFRRHDGVSIQLHDAGIDVGLAQQTYENRAGLAAHAGASFQPLVRIGEMIAPAIGADLPQQPEVVVLPRRYLQAQLRAAAK